MRSLKLSLLAATAAVYPLSTLASDVGNVKGGFNPSAYGRSPVATAAPTASGAAEPIMQPFVLGSQTAASAALQPTFETEPVLEPDGGTNAAAQGAASAGAGDATAPVMLGAGSGTGSALSGANSAGSLANSGIIAFDGGGGGGGGGGSGGGSGGTDPSAVLQQLVQARQQVYQTNYQLFYAAAQQAGYSDSAAQKIAAQQALNVANSFIGANANNLDGALATLWGTGQYRAVPPDNYNASTTYNADMPAWAAQMGATSYQVTMSNGVMTYVFYNSNNSLVGGIQVSAPTQTQIGADPLPQTNTYINLSLILAQPIGPGEGPAGDVEGAGASQLLANELSAAEQASANPTYIGDPSDPPGLATLKMQNDIASNWGAAANYRSIGYDPGTTIPVRSAQAGKLPGATPWGGPPPDVGPNSYGSIGPGTYVPPATEPSFPSSSSLSATLVPPGGAGPENGEQSQAGFGGLGDAGMGSTSASVSFGGPTAGAGIGGSVAGIDFSTVSGSASASANFGPPSAPPPIIDVPNAPAGVAVYKDGSVVSLNNVNGISTANGWTQVGNNWYQTGSSAPVAPSGVTTNGSASTPAPMPAGPQLTTNGSIFTPTQLPAGSQTTANGSVYTPPTASSTPSTPSIPDNSQLTANGSAFTPTQLPAGSQVTANGSTYTPPSGTTSTNTPSIPDGSQITSNGSVYTPPTQPDGAQTTSNGSVYVPPPTTPASPYIQIPQSLISQDISSQQIVSASSLGSYIVQSNGSLTVTMQNGQIATFTANQIGIDPQGNLYVATVGLVGDLSLGASVGSTVSNILANGGGLSNGYSVETFTRTNSSDYVATGSWSNGQTTYSLVGEWVNPNSNDQPISASQASSLIAAAHASAPSPQPPGNSILSPMTVDQSSPTSSSSSIFSPGPVGSTGAAPSLTPGGSPTGYDN